MRHSFLFFFTQSTISLTISTPSTKFLPLMKADWFEEIMESITLASLLANTLAIILYIQPRREMRRNSDKEIGELTFGYLTCVIMTYLWNIIGGVEV
jgi:hypothetical protein